jgi:multicomponent Na+:H+ antiporter subunit D
MPKTTILCIVGAASISAFPLFSGFVSKSMVMSAALEEGYDWIWLMLLFASAGVFHHAGIKIPYFAFFAHDSGLKASDPPKNMLFAMTIAAALCIAIGIYPSALYALLPYDTGYNPYDATHVLAQTQLLFFSALAFVWLNLKGMYPPELRSTNLDFDWIYRRAMPLVFQNMFSVIWKIDRMVRESIKEKLGHSFAYLASRNNRLSGLLSRNHPSGSMAMWIAVMLAIYLLLSFVK